MTIVSHTCITCGYHGYLGNEESLIKHQVRDVGVWRDTGTRTDAGEKGKAVSNCGPVLSERRGH